MATYTFPNGNVYTFSFEKQSNGTIRAYITNMPLYGSRDTNLVATHRHADGQRHYVCWDTPLYTQADADAVAKGWARRTERYITTGKRFHE